MTRKVIILTFLLLTVMILAGCAPLDVDQLYCLPKKTEAFNNLQSAIDSALGTMEYCSPDAGENRQIVQQADLDGDGSDEYIVFALGSGEKPLHIFLFASDGQHFSLIDSAACNGVAFDRVEYVPMDPAAGNEIVVGCKLNDRVFRSVYVFSLASGKLVQSVQTSYSRFLTADLDNDSFSELMILNEGNYAAESANAQFISLENGQMERSAQITISVPVDKALQICAGKLADGHPAVVITGETEDQAAVTDILSVVDGQFTNMSISGGSTNGQQGLQNHNIFAGDINHDGILEIPAVEDLRLPDGTSATEDQYLIRWFSVLADGKQTDQLYTYHNFPGGWYLQLDKAIATNICVIHQGSSFEFKLWRDDGAEMQTLFTIYVLTGQKREEQAIANNRFVLYRTDSAVYAAKLEVASAAYGMSRDSMISSFYRILPDQNSGET